MDPAETAPTGNETTTTPAFPSGDPAPAEAPAFESFVPDGFKDKTWVQEHKGGAETLFQMIEDQKAALSKRPGGIPEDNATPEQRAEFNKAFGVPEKSDGYELPSTEDGDTQGAEFNQKIQELYHKADLNTAQAKIISDGFGDLAQGMAPDPEVQEAEFQKLMDAEFGADAGKVSNEANVLIARFTPDSMKDDIDKLGNKEQMVLASVLKGIRDEYISEDEIPSGPGAATSNPADKIAEAQAIIADKNDPYHDPMHPQWDARHVHVNKLFGTHIEK